MQHDEINQSVYYTANRIYQQDNEKQSNDNYVDKENVNPYLQNSKVRKGRGRLLGTKRLKLSHEVVKPKTKQQCR
ncbi:15512_t:CDS:2, partial [Dentiscutata erythropus]